MSGGDTVNSDSEPRPLMDAANLREYDLLYIDARRLSRDCVSRQLAMHLPELSIESVMSAADLPAARERLAELGHSPLLTDAFTAARREPKASAA